MPTEDRRQAVAAEWAQRARRLEPMALAWVYESSNETTADLARRIVAQTVGLRRLLDQMAGQP